MQQAKTVHGRPSDRPLGRTVCTSCTPVGRAIDRLLASVNRAVDRALL